MFYRYINGKMTNKETIDEIIKGDRICKTAEEISETMNENFSSVFTKEENFMKPNKEMQQGLKEIVVNKWEVGKLMEELDVRKAMGPDGVAGWTLKE